MGALPSIAKAGRGRICIKKRMTSLLPAIAFTSLAFQGPALAQDGGLPKQYLEWQQECVRKNLYTRPARRESLRRFGISVEIPEGMDFQVDGGGDSSTVWITEIEGIALKDVASSPKDSMGWRCLGAAYHHSPSRPSQDFRSPPKTILSTQH